jgi:hypothetical protein
LRRSFLAPTIRTKRKDPDRWLVAELGIWNGSGIVLGHEPTTIDVFSPSGPVWKNVFDIFTLDMNNRHFYKVWSLAAASDVDGCLALEDPKTLTWQLPLSNTNVPVLCLLDKLAALGYVPRSETLAHAPLSGL